MIFWIVVLVGVITIMVILDREIYYYDAAHLGPRVQGWLYNSWAKNYDRSKQASQVKDTEMLTQPLLERLAKIRALTPGALVLDVATGTGRLPLALLKADEFTGRVIGLDVSHGMLKRANEKLAKYQERVLFVRNVAAPLPFPDNAFDLVSCVEALELMPDIPPVMSELARVLRPGGILITSRCTKAWGREIRLRSVDEFTGILQTAGFEQVEFLPWWEWFDRVFARKAI